MIATATATATIGASSSGAQRRSTERVDSAAMPGPMVRALNKRAWSELEDDVFDGSLQLYLGPTTKRAKYASTADEESAVASVHSNDDMSVGGSTGDGASQTGMDIDEARLNKRKRSGNGNPSCRRKKRGVVIAVEPMSVDDVSMRTADEESAVAIVHSNDDMSVGGSTGDGASQTGMDIDEARLNKRKRSGNGNPSCRRKKRGVVIAVEPMSVDDVSMRMVSREVEALTNDGLNGPYWLMDEAFDHRCGDMSGLEIEVQSCARSMRRRRRNDLSRMPPAANSDFANGDEDAMMEIDSLSGDDSSRGEISDFDDDLSVMSDLTDRSNVYSGADWSNPLFGGVDTRAVDVMAEMMQRLSLSTDLVRMDVDADDESVAFRQYLLRSVLVLPQNRHMYFTRAIARSLEALAESFAKRTRSGRRY